MGARVQNFAYIHCSWVGLMILLPCSYESMQHLLQQVGSTLCKLEAEDESSCKNNSLDKSVSQHCKVGERKRMHKWEIGVE